METTGRKFSGIIHLEILDTEGCIVADARLFVDLGSGKLSFQIPLNLPPAVAV